MVDEMTVSVVVSAYNAANSIKRCVSSILAQTEAFDEIILYNDASTDNTAAILKKLQEQSKNVIFIDSNKNRGPGGGKNYAKGYVTSEYFLFVDADDYIAETYLEKLKKKLDDGKPDIVFGGLTRVDKNGRIKYKREYRKPEEALIGGVSNWGCLYKREFFVKNHISIPSGKVLDDLLTRAVIVCNSPTVRIAKGCCGYFYVENSKSVTQTYMKTFLPGVMRKEMRFLWSNVNKISEENKALFTYYAYKVVCWHLLKSGAGVGWKNMEREASIAFSCLKSYFPDYKRNIYLRHRPPRGERREVVFAVKLMFKLESMGILDFFMCIYASIDLSFLWPSL